MSSSGESTEIEKQVRALVDYLSTIDLDVILSDEMLGEETALEMVCFFDFLAVLILAVPKENQTSSKFPILEEEISEASFASVRPMIEIFLNNAGTELSKENPDWTGMMVACQKITFEMRQAGSLAGN